MKSFALAFVALFLAFTPALAAPLEVYGRLPAIEDVQISPNGQRVAMMMTKGEGRYIFVFKLDTMDQIAAVSAGDNKVRSMEWADDDNIIFQLSGVTAIEADVLEVSYGFLFTVSTKAQKPLVFNLPEAQNRIYNQPVVRKVDGKTQIFVRTQGLSGGAYDGDVLVMSDPTAKRSVVVNRGDLNQNDWVVDAGGKVLVQTAFDDEKFQNAVRSRMIVFGPKGKRTVNPPPGKVLFDAAGLSADGAAIIAHYGDYDGGEMTIGYVSIDEGAWLPQTLPNDAANLKFDPATGRLVSYRLVKGDETLYTFTNPDTARFWANVEKAFKGSVVTPVSWSQDYAKVIVLVDSPTDGPAYALVERATMSADWLGDAYSLKPQDIAPVQAVKYKAADDLEITGYLTLPRGAEAKGLPLVVLPHGGPASRDTPGFDWWSQALASRGYAVLRPNFRGSDGLGKPFMDQGAGEWGRKMQTDLSDGVRYLAAQGTIDPARVCIVGASYGGYAALAGATIDRGVYRCAVSVAGPSDLEKMLVASLEKDGRNAFKYWAAYMGVNGRASGAMADISPIRNADKATIPVLMVHGKDDTVVPYVQSTIMARALQDAGKPVELVTLDGEDHWLSKAKTRLLMLQSVVAFLEKHNPPNPPARTASLP
jgi:dipeptidyl aminopeptidase/acylaminoacyl peptidase